MVTSTSGGIRAFEKGVQILDALRRADGPMRLSQIAPAASMSLSAARGYLVSLIRTGLVRQDAQTGLYDLGDAALHLGLAALRRLSFLDRARETLNELARLTQETAVLSVWSPGGAVVVDKIEGQNDGFYEVRIGRLVTLRATATGRVFMAFLPESLWVPLVGAPAELAPELEKIRRERLAVVRTETRPGSAAIAGPVFDHSGGLKGVISVVGPGTETDGSSTRPLIANACQHLSAQLGAPMP